MSSGQNEKGEEKGSEERKNSGVKEAKVNVEQTWKFQNFRYVILNISYIQSSVFI